MSGKDYYVYILANKRNGTLYIGVTNDLERRIQEHKQKIYEQGFTSQYEVSHLIYYEHTNSVESALAREKQLKNWKREWKLELIERHNPLWKDLSE
jgi:putative endonuclease